MTPAATTGRVRRPGSQGQTDAPVTVSRRDAGRGTALTDASEGRPGTRPASKCPWKTRTDGAEGLPQRLQETRRPSPRRGPRLPWKSKGEPTDFLLDTGNRFLRVDRQKQARRLAGVTTQKEERRRPPEPLTHAATGSRNVSSSDVPERPYSRMGVGGVGWGGDRLSELGAWVRWLGRTVQAESPRRQGFRSPNAPLR